MNNWFSDSNGPKVQDVQQKLNKKHFGAKDEKSLPDTALRCHAESFDKRWTFIENIMFQTIWPRSWFFLILFCKFECQILSNCEII